MSLVEIEPTAVATFRRVITVWKPDVPVLPVDRSKVAALVPAPTKPDGNLGRRLQAIALGHGFARDSACVCSLVSESFNRPSQRIDGAGLP